MMRVLVLSDSHGRNENMLKVLEMVGKIDWLIHLGDILGSEDYLRMHADCNVSVVRGNCDFLPDRPESIILEMASHRIFAAHGHQYYVKYGYEKLAQKASAERCDIALCGHTHVPASLISGGIRIFNPGSISMPRQENRKPSYGILEFDGDGSVDARIVYLG